MAAEWNEQRFEHLLGNVLRSGVVVAASIVLAGAALYLVHHGHEVPEYHVFHGEPGDLRSVGGVLAGALDARGRGLIQFGLLVLIATPVTRVVLSAVVFAIKRDRLYVVFTLVVLAVLVLSLLGK